MRTDTDPGPATQEAVQASLFPHHPYGTPVIGWGHEIEALDRGDALTYYERFYTPGNAILIVAGDVEAAEVARLARENIRTHCRHARNRRGAFVHRSREPRAHRLVTLEMPRSSSRHTSAFSSCPPTRPRHPAKPKLWKC